MPRSMPSDMIVIKSSPSIKFAEIKAEIVPGSLDSTCSRAREIQKPGGGRGSFSRGCAQKQLTRSAKLAPPNTATSTAAQPLRSAVPQWPFARNESHDLSVKLTRQCVHGAGHSAQIDRCPSVGERERAVATCIGERTTTLTSQVRDTSPGGMLRLVRYRRTLAT